MSHFCLLRDAENYVAHDWDLVQDEQSRKHWLDMFSEHFDHALKCASANYGRSAARQIESARTRFAAVVEQLRADPKALPGGRLNIMELCRAREKVLRENRLHDPFGYIKKRENASAAKLYLQVVRKLHAMKGQSKWLHLVECIFGGNIFDLGAPMTMHLATQPTDFLAAVEQTKPRPWFVDDFDRLAQDLPDRPPCKWGKAVVFIDNAGSDFVLGLMPLMRELALYGTKIVVAANELPCLNDMTADEAVKVIAELSAIDGDLEAMVNAGMFEVVSTGNDLPLIDLSNVSDELNEASADAELVIIEGMGRAVESNFNAAMTVDTLLLALIKDAAVAQKVGAEMFDCVCKYKPAGN